MDAANMEILLNNIRRIVREELNKHQVGNLNPPAGLTNKPLYEQATYFYWPCFYFFL